jgi:hypothetical protein
MFLGIVISQGRDITAEHIWEISEGTDGPRAMIIN